MKDNNYIIFNDRLLKVNRTIIEHKLKTGFNQQLLKEWSMSDTILKRDGVIYCCEIIQEAVMYDPKDDIQLQLDFCE